MPLCSRSYPNADCGCGRPVLPALHRTVSGRIRWQVAVLRRIRISWENKCLRLCSRWLTIASAGYSWPDLVKIEWDEIFTMGSSVRWMLVACRQLIYLLLSKIRRYIERRLSMYVRIGFSSGFLPCIQSRSSASKGANIALQFHNSKQKGWQINRLE